jgi:hypothetical protein
MSLHNDYSTAIMARQQHQELLARAAEDRLARQMLRSTDSWWSRLARRATGRRTKALASGMTPLADAPQGCRP